MSKFLLILLVAVLVKQVAWITFLPLWQTPDEQAHFGQVSASVETGNIFNFGLNLSREIFNSEKIMGTLRDDNGNNKYTFHPKFNINYSNGSIGPSEKELTSSTFTDRKTMILSESTNYPPLYYSLSGLLYKFLYSSSLLDRVFAVRVLSGILLAGIVFVTYQCGMQIFSNHKKALILGILVGFQPMLGFVHSGVTSDALFNLVFAVFFYLCLKLINKGLTLSNIISLGVLMLVGQWTKPQANVMAFILIPLIILIVIGKYKSLRKVNLLVKVGICAAVLVSLLGIINRFSHGAPLIPNTEMGIVDASVTPVEHLIFTLRHTYYEVLPWYWGVFRWLSLALPDPLRKITNWLTILSFVGLAPFFFGQIYHKKISLVTKQVLFSFFVFVTYFAALAVFDFGFRQSHGFSFGMQGRYYFPVIVPQMVIFLVGLGAFFPQKWQPFVDRLLALGMITINIIVFFWVTGSYYQLSLPAFFLEASQYKPFWLKYPINELILLFSLLSSFFCCGWLLKNGRLFEDTKDSGQN